MLLSTLLAGVALAGVVDPRASTAKAKGSSKPAAVDKGKGHTATSACHKAMFQAITGKTVKRETDGETDDEPVPFVLSKRAKPPVEMGLAADATAADGLTTTGLATCFGLGLTIPSTPAPLTNKVLAHVNPNGFVGLSAFETKATAAVHAAKQANPRTYSPCLSSVWGLCPG